MTVFVSHSSDDTALIRTLVRDLESVDEVWVDHELKGGDAWWSEILVNIRGCAVFVYAVSPRSLESEACAAEFEYATALGKPIVPVEIVSVVGDRRNHSVFSHQSVSYARPDDTTSMRSLFAAVTKAARSSRPLPDPLPAEPPIPYAYLMELGKIVARRQPIGWDEQRRMITDLEDAIRFEKTSSVRRSIRDILLRFRERGEIAHLVRLDIDRLLAIVDESLAETETETETVHDPGVPTVESRAASLVTTPGSAPDDSERATAAAALIAATDTARTATPTHGTTPTGGTAPAGAATPTVGSAPSLRDQSGRRAAEPDLSTRVSLPAPPSQPDTQRSTSPAAPTQPAGWYPNEADRRYLRWWDGQRWTDHLIPVNAPSPTPGRKARPAGNVLSIITLVLAVLSLIPYVVVFTFIPGLVLGIVAAARRERLGVVALICVLIAIVLGWVISSVVAAGVRTT